jgi:deazaflavin-dependent oxidoreductase (nitroreductase family)
LTSLASGSPSSLRRRGQAGAHHRVIRHAVGSALRSAGRPVIIIAHRGAKSGELHETPVMKIKHADRYIVVASMAGAPMNPSCYHNMIANPLVEVQDRAKIMRMIAREAPAEAKDALWKIADAAWPHFPEYRASTERDIPILILHNAPGEIQAPKEAAG